MIKYQLKYGIQVSLNATTVEVSSPIAFTLQYENAKEYFLPTLRREMESLTGCFGHTISLDSIAIPDFVKIMNELNDQWGAELIEGADLADLPISKIPTGTVS